MPDHPDFVAAAPTRRWRGRSLIQLWTDLNQRADLEAERMEPGDLPVWYVLPHGALVSLTLEEGRRVLRIARSSKPSDAGSAFEKECAVFARHFGIARWERERDREAVGVGMIYREPLSLFEGAGE